MNAPAFKLPTRMTVDEFLAWDAPGRWQLVDGEAVAMAPTSDAHGAIQNELGRLLGNHLLAQGSPCRVVSNPGVVPRVGADGNFRIPDLGVACRQAGADETVLLVEILSPSNEAQTRANVWAYSTIPSVRDILMVRSTRVEAELLQRGEDGTWPERGTLMRKGDTLTLGSIGFTAALADVYRTVTLP